MFGIVNNKIPLVQTGRTISVSGNSVSFADINITAGYEDFSSELNNTVQIVQVVIPRDNSKKKKKMKERWDWPSP
jgi:hypothetical protein